MKAQTQTDWAARHVEDRSGPSGAAYVGRNTERQAIGKPGHCESYEYPEGQHAFLMRGRYVHWSDIRICLACSGDLNAPQHTEWKRRRDIAHQRWIAQESSWNPERAASTSAARGLFQMLPPKA